MSLPNFCYSREGFAARNFTQAINETELAELALAAKYLNPQLQII